MIRVKLASMNEENIHIHRKINTIYKPLQTFSEAQRKWIKQYLVPSDLLAQQSYPGSV